MAFEAKVLRDGTTTSPEKSNLKRCKLPCAFNHGELVQFLMGMSSRRVQELVVLVACFLSFSGGFCTFGHNGHMNGGLNK